VRAWSSTLLAFIGLSCAPGAVAGDNGIILTQTSKTHGVHTSYLRKDAVKIVSKNTGVVMVTHAPLWRIIVYNTRARRSFETTLDKFKGEVSSRLFEGHRNNLAYGTWSKGEACKACGVDVVEWENNRPPPREHLRPNARFDFGNIDNVRSARYWVLRDFEVSPQVGVLMARIDGVPKSPQVPIKCTYKDVAGTDYVQLLTEQYKTANLPDTLFEPPPDLKPVDNEDLVYEDAQSQEIMKGCLDFLDDVDPDLKRAREKKAR
jgi:hypothetical protein